MKGFLLLLPEQPKTELFVFLYLFGQVDRTCQRNGCYDCCFEPVE